MSSAFSASISGAGATVVMPLPSRAARSRCDPPVRRVATEPDRRARLEPKAADAIVLEVDDRDDAAEMSASSAAVGPAPPVARLAVVRTTSTWWAGVPQTLQ